MDKQHETHALTYSGTPWGSALIVGGRALADLTVREAARLAGVEFGRWSLIEAAHAVPGIRWLLQASAVWSAADHPARLAWWQLLASAWWFQTGDDQFLMPVWNWGEAHLRETFEIATELAVTAIQAVDSGKWPALADDFVVRYPWPGLQKLVSLHLLRPDDLQRPRTHSVIEPLFFTLILWNEFAPKVLD